MSRVSIQFIGFIIMLYPPELQPSGNMLLVEEQNLKAWQINDFSQYYKQNNFNNKGKQILQ